ncbi:hypothetical protein QYF61_018180 [Mycteria americana]|uniref:Uncharacterized protein n=1 Tax=Mycteria americana TaxID=33587 RepID=A0AAN7NKZ5_MYCAM|nr:hypothetical protein QYF61_018180 [Mycteria americana]
MLTGPDHLVVLYVPRDGTQDDLLHNLPQHQECPAFLDSFALQDCLPRDSLNQAPKQAKVCPPEVQVLQDLIGIDSELPQRFFAAEAKWGSVITRLRIHYSDHKKGQMWDEVDPRCRAAGRKSSGKARFAAAAATGLHWPSLDTLQHLNVSLVVRGPKLNTVFEVRPHQCRVQANNHFPSPAGHTISDTSQDAIGLLGHLGTVLAHIQPALDQHSQVLFHQAAFQPLFPKSVALHGVVVTQVQDSALSLVESHTIGLSPSIQPVQVPLWSLPTLRQINAPGQLGVICRLTEAALNALIQIIDKDIKQNWPQH